MGFFARKGGLGVSARGQKPEILTDLLCIALLLAVQVLASPWWNLTENPPVYHDEYTLLSPSLDLLAGRGMAVSFLRTPDNLTDILGVSPPITVPRQPTFVLVFASFLWAFGSNIETARWLSYGLGVLCLLATYFLGRRASGPGAGLAASCLLALDSNFWLASRQVRPETLTLAMFLLGALLLPWALKAARSWAAAGSGACLGLGLLGHPIGAASLASPLILSLPVWRQAPRRVRLAALLPVSVLGVAYGAWILSHWSGFREDLQRFAVTRGLESSAPGLGRELARYLGGYDNGYWLKFGEALFLGSVSICLLAVVAALSRRQSPPPFGLVALGAGFITALLARDLNPLYLVNLAPWIYLGAACAVSAITNAPAVKRFRPILGALLVGFSALWLTGPYRQSERPPSLGFDRIEGLIETAIPAGSTLIGAETAFLMAERRHASFLFSLQYAGHTPRNARYPISATWVDQTHLKEYSVNMEIIRELARKGPLFFFLDQWDLAWNLYAPFGAYAPAYRDLDAALERAFEPRTMVLTPDRGLTTLWVYRESPDPEAWRLVPFFDGAVPVRLGRDAPVIEGGPRTFDATQRDQARTVFATVPGARYWLHIEAASEDGALVLPSWNGATLPRWLDARVPIPFDFPVQATSNRSELRFESYAPTAQVIMKAVRATRLSPEALGSSNVGQD